MTVCDSCHQLTMDSITICNECRREQEEFDVVECANGCGEEVLFGGYCSTACKNEHGENFYEQRK